MGLGNDFSTTCENVRPDGLRSSRLILYQQELCDSPAQQIQLLHLKQLRLQRKIGELSEDPRYTCIVYLFTRAQQLRRYFGIKKNLYTLTLESLIKVAILPIKDQNPTIFVFNSSRASKVLHQMTATFGPRTTIKEYRDKPNAHKNPDRWFMGEKVDLFYGEYGITHFAKESDYDRQEELSVRGILAEILIGMLMLREGGSLVVKTYTFFTSEMQGVVAMIRQYFAHVHISKPDYSKTTNSERYLVCTGYHNIISLSDSKLLYRALDPKNPKNELEEYCMPAEEVLKIENRFTKVQIASMRLVVSVYKLYKEGKLVGDVRAKYLLECLQDKGVSPL